MKNEISLANAFTIKYIIKHAKITYSLMKNEFEL